MRPALYAVTGSRLFAALAVLAFHFHIAASSHLPEWSARLGGAGVSFFFVLSGFALTYRYAGRLHGGGALRDFYVSRFARIVPAYVVALCITTVVVISIRAQHVGAVLPWSRDHLAQVAASWFANLAAIQAYFPYQWVQQPWNAPAWSVGCEVFFYAVFPLFLVALGRARSIAAVATLVFAVNVALHAFVFEHYVADKTDGAYADALLLQLRFPAMRLGEFLTGCCAAHLFLRRHSSSGASTLLAFGLAGAIVVHLAGRAEPSLPAVPLRAPFFAAVLYALACGRTFLNPLLERRSIVWLGEKSYSIYLVHWAPLILLFHHYGYGRAPVSVVVAVALSCIPLAILLHAGVERPARDWLRSAARRQVAYTRAAQTT